MCGQVFYLYVEKTFFPQHLALLNSKFFLSPSLTHLHSLCLQYGSKDVAVAARERLHGLKWPSTNPKLLSVDFLSPEEVQKISEGDLVVMTAPPEVGEKEAGGEVGG